VELIEFINGIDAGLLLAFLVSINARRLTTQLDVGTHNFRRRGKGAVVARADASGTRPSAWKRQQDASAISWMYAAQIR
jgi:hypothetical protein